MSAEQRPFVVLGIEPTVDRALIKRAYFLALQRHPPHEDPRGFRQIRDAYESLTGDALLPAWAAAGVDVERALAAIDAQLRPQIELALAQLEAQEGGREAIAAFEALLTLDLAAASERCR